MPVWGQEYVGLRVVFSQVLFRQTRPRCTLGERNFDRFVWSEVALYRSFPANSCLGSKFSTLRIWILQALAFAHGLRLAASPTLATALIAL